MIDLKDITFVLQGAIDKKHTPRCIDAIKTLFPQSVILLSTWEGTDTSNYQCDKIILSKDPGGFKDKIHYTFVNNLLRQLVSTQAALQQVETKYTVKMRTDILFRNKNFLKFFDKFDKYEPEYKIFDKRIVTLSFFSKRFLTSVDCSFRIEPTPYQISDWFAFGLTEDIKKLYMIKLPEEPKTTEYFYKYSGTKFDKNAIWCSHQYSPEQYIVYNAFKQQKNDIKPFENYLDYNNDNIDESEHLVINNFTIISPKELGIVCLKERTNNNIDFYRRWCEHPLTMPFFVWNGLYRRFVFEKLYKEFCDKNYNIPLKVIANEYIERLLIARGRKCIIL